MRFVFFNALMLLLSLMACTSTDNTPIDEANALIRVGIFDTNGDSPGCIVDAYEALRVDSMMHAEVIGAATIMSDDILNFDLILFPGGSGKAQTIKLGQLGMQRVQSLVVDEGIGVLGICAGSYVLSQTDGYPSLDLSGMQAIDIEHDHRGHGLVKFSLTDEGKNMFPELSGKDVWYSQYYEGPVLTVPEQPLFKAKSLATMLSDVHTVEGTPLNMTNNRPFITATEAGRGRVVTFVGHPENTPGMRWMIPRMVRWAVNRPFIAYSKQVVRPHIYDQEILYTPERLQQQDNYFNMLWEAPDQKVEAINRLVAQSSWSAKKKVIGLLRDESPEVRLAAARAIVELERTDALEDLNMAVLTEKDIALKAQLEVQFDLLKRMVVSPL